MESPLISFSITCEARSANSLSLPRGPFSTALFSSLSRNLKIVSSAGPRWPMETSCTLVLVSSSSSLTLPAPVLSPPTTVILSAATVLTM